MNDSLQSPVKSAIPVCTECVDQGSGQSTEAVQGEESLTQVSSIEDPTNESVACDT